MGNARHVGGLVGGVGVTDAKQARLAEGGLLAVQGATALDTRTGVLIGPGSTALVTGTSATGPMTVAIGVHHAVTSRGTANGPYLGPVLEAATTVNIAAAPGSGQSRIDVVYVKQQDGQSGIPSPDATTAPLYGVLQGTAAATGTQTKPNLATIVGAEELATVQVSAGATSTNGAGVTITNTARQTVARGARIPVRNQAERDALTAFPSLEVYRIDTGQVQLCTAIGPTVWATTYDPALPLTTALTMQTGWDNFGAGYDTLKATKHPSGLVTLQGLVKNLNSVPAQLTLNIASNIAALPSWAVPGANLMCLGVSASGATLSNFRCDISTTGFLILQVNQVAQSADAYWWINATYKP